MDERDAKDRSRLLAEGGSFEKNPLGHWFLNLPNGKPFTVNSTYYLYAIQKEINANPNINSSLIFDFDLNL